MREKAVRLIEYLLRLASLKSTPIRDISSYEKVLWISDIPKVGECFTQAWDRDENKEFWIEIKRRNEPKRPEVPDKCRNWILENDLLARKENPQLRQEIIRQVPNPEWREGSDQPEFAERTERLENHPQVKEAWDNYLLESYWPYLENHKEWEKVHEPYSLLFEIHHEQLRLGEEYELVLGLGLLTWQTSNNQRIRRHLLVANTSLEFEKKSGKFTVRPHPDGANVRPELDMLDSEERPHGAEELAKSTLAEFDDPWDKNSIGSVLKSLVHSISANGEYSDKIKAETGATQKPTVTYAPAIILRKRSAKGHIEALEKIKQKIENGEPIPDNFGALAEIDPVNDTEIAINSDDAEFKGEIYFPKPSNDEQRKIVENIRKSNGVLVQGPPGTGKSHTIANLICHLLATGLRILVTAKTPRALQVLAGLLPEEISPLCINLLGESGSEEKRSLEVSVRGILSKNVQRNDGRDSKKIKQLEGEIQKLREEKSEIDRSLRAIRESETHRQTIANGAYHGTAAEIAKKIKDQESSFSWFTDAVTPDQTCPLKSDDLLKILTILRDLTPDKKRELELEWPESLITQEQFEKLVTIERSAAEKEQSLAHNADTHIADILSNVNERQVQNLHGSLQTYLNSHANLSRKPHKWIPEAIRNTVGNNSGEWRHLRDVTLDIINGIESIIKLADDAKIDSPSAIEDVALLEDAKELKCHLENGGGLGWWLFRPKIVSERLYVIKEVRINGQKADNLSSLQTLIQVLSVRLAFKKAWKLWAGCCERNSELYSQQLVQLKELCEVIGEIVALENMINQLRLSLHECHGLLEPEWHDLNHVRIFSNSCALALARIAKKRAYENIRDAEKPLTTIVGAGKAHPAVKEILSAIQRRDCTAFALGARKISNLNQEKLSFQKAMAYLDKMGQIAPNLTQTLIQTSGDTCWDTRIKNVQDAWYWMQAKTWVEKYIRKEDAPELAIRLERTEKKISENIAELASLHAWSFCFQRLTKSHQEHMVGWQQAMGLVRGKGKRAPHHRREAQRHLNKCRETVPAWVMPLHRVWDTINPEPGMFDVVIVDEASQCGPEALPLLYLGKKMLIVGDDQQISPDPVAVERDGMSALMRQFLNDFNHSDSFDLERSIFDHASRRFHSGRITLREHFRCMPEIIRFSNALCYSDTPLIPLRQYGPNRLTPLERVFVPKGFREGSDENVINRHEAICIAKKIEELCRDKRYTEKTMGVVTLQGNAQAKIIQNELRNLIGDEEMGKRKIVCGKPYSFQGDERDIIFLSMVAAPNERIGALTEPKYARSFNVAASRAKDQMWLFHSVKREDLNLNCLRRKLLEFFFEDEKPQTIAGIPLEELERKAYQTNRTLGNQPPPFDSWFEVDVALELLRRGYTVIPQYPFAGRKIDLVVEGGIARLAVECDGDNWHGLEQYEDDVSRQRQLERCGWVFFRIRESAFRLDKEEALNGLWRLLEERGIMPWQCDVGSAPDVGTIESEHVEAEDGEVNDEGDDAEDEDDAHMLEDSEKADDFTGPSLEGIASSEIRRAIIHALEKCPNKTCTLNSITARVLKVLGVITRGKPREKFEKRVMAALNNLEREALIEKYKAKNKRIRLLTSDIPVMKAGSQGRALSQNGNDVGVEKNIQPELKFAQTSSNRNFQRNDIGEVEVDIEDTVVYVDLESPETKKKVRITRDVSHPDYGIINAATPIAKELLGARVGDIVEVILPHGPAKLQVKEIEKS